MSIETLAKVVKCVQTLRNIVNFEHYLLFEHYKLFHNFL